MRYLITTLLRADGYAVSECADGNQLMERIDAREEQAPGPPDVVVCDVCMPGPTGLEVLAEVRARHIRTPVILISAFGDEQIRYGGAELGAVAFLEKPFAIDELRAVLRALCPASP
jgi:DNA-binding response OmpR family regulator